eukprot:TRINITY_DN40373_c0_g1_i1.p1 TRINITY_DN40373_c0_g1~~TRINITY_DN40373_c0_g1_i1.p1  ORF type:complete len:463 (+),score=96.19 TRINITY_DN40373_c0_g1_i1:74-1390(+)
MPGPLLRVAAVAALIPAAQSTLIESQTPSIVPAGGEFIGEVPHGGIALLSNAPRDRTRLFYTINDCNPTAVPGCAGWRRPKPAEAGVGQDTKELKWGEKVPLSKPGLWFISAVAITQGLGDSFVENATFRIKHASLDPPEIAAPAGKYRKKVEVQIDSKVAGATVHYTTDGSQPTSQSPKYTAPFEITLPGRHVVKAINVKGDDESPTRQSVYVISLPVAYMVSTECEKCKGPTVDEPFTLMFQGFRSSPQTKVFVTTSMRACEVASNGAGIMHTLQGCGCADSPSNPKGGIVPKDLTWHIHTLDSPTSDVYVCFSDDGGNSWSLMPRATSGEEQQFSFPLYANEGEKAGGHRVAGGTGGVEAFDAPFDWRDHHRQEREQLIGGIKSRIPGRAGQIRERMNTNQGKSLVAGAMLLLAGGVALVFFRRRRRGASVHVSS